ncbi:MAG: hypothetical protein KJZ80_06460 [Hyphomicrobiaceae bacterium]|nr:hypothetical protein [Hyphomicrobiaceae bacterium]
MTARTVDLTTTFRYRHGLGDLTPYFDGLERGEAMATICSDCRRTWFAPRLVCACGSGACTWVRLPGTGVVVAATEGVSALPLTDRKVHGAVALIAMDGADNAVLGRLVEGAKSVAGIKVRLTVDPQARSHPVQAALYRPVDP